MQNLPLHLYAQELWQRRQARKSLASYIEWLDVGFTPAKHHRLIIEKLEAVERGDIKRLMLFLPPGSAKSTYASVMFPSWYLGRNPKKQVIAASHTAELAENFGRRVRNLVNSDDFRRLYEGAHLADDSQAAGRWDMREGGGYYAVGVGGSVTGRRADLAILDDVVRSREDADSERVRQKTWDWYLADLKTRLKPGAGMIVIMTRWHSDDLAGRLIADQEKGGEQWEVVSLPMEAGLNDPLGRQPGDLLWPEWYTKDMVTQAKRDSRNWSALYQQSPTIDGGNILKAHWWRIWPESKKLPTCDHVFLSWDTAYSDDAYKSNSHSAMTAWGVFWHEPDDRHCLILLRAWNGQIDYPELRKKAKELDKELEPDCHLIEKKASGQSLIQDMKRIPGVRVRTYNPDKDKVTRAYSVQAMLESGQVFAPDRRWAESLIEHVSQFPNGAPPSSDYTDTVTQALLYLRNGWWIEHPEDKLPSPPASNDEDEDSQPKVARLYG